MAEITKSGVAALGSQEDLKNIKAALEADGSISVVDDPEPEIEQDAEGNDLPPEQAVAVSGPVEIKVENVAAPAEEEEAAAAE